MTKFKSLTHYLAVAFLAAAGFLVTPAGLALVHQYSFIAPVATAIGAIAVYFQPKTTA